MFFRPKRLPKKVKQAGILKAKISTINLVVLAMLAGTFIALGALFFTLVVADSAFCAGPTPLLGGIAFSLGLILVVVAGAELFTGNALMVIAWADHRISARLSLRNWGIVWGGNFAGALIVAVLVVLAGL